jgi:hypothetical protein
LSAFAGGRYDAESRFADRHAKEAAVSSICRSTFAALALAALLVSCPAAAPAPAKPTPEQIAGWVKQLGDNDFAAREEATKRLWKAGEAAEPALQAAMSSDDAEVKRRARELLDKFRWGIYPDTPPKVVELITAYKAGDANSKTRLIGELVRAGSHGCRAVVKIARAEEPALRRQLFAQVAGELSNAVPAMLEEGNFDRLEALVEASLASDVRSGVTNYTAFWVLRGKLNERIALHKALAAKGGAEQEQQYQVLAYLHRAKGDLAAARRAAEKSGRKDLVEAILYEAGDWKELARRPDLLGKGNEVEKLGYKAAYARLAGDTKTFEGAVSDLRKSADAAPDRPQAKMFAPAKALFLNGRPADALEALAKGNHPELLFEVLCARLQFREALELADKTVAAGGPRSKALEALKARTLYILGEKDKARAVFASCAAAIKDGVDDSWYETLINADARAGLPDQAFEHAARILTVSRDQGMPIRLFPKLFPERAETAEALWAILRQQNPAQQPPDTLKLVRALLEGKASLKEVTTVVEQAAPKLAGLRVDEADRWVRALAEAALACKQEALARAALEKAATPGALLRLGDLLARKKDWKGAAERYRQAWQAWEKQPPPREVPQPLPLYLAGWALEKDGQAAEGKKRMEQAHWVLLGDEAERLAFARELARRGHAEAAAREYRLLTQVGHPGSFYAGEALRRVAIDALTRKDYLKAAEGHEQAMLRCLQPYIDFVNPSAYLGVPVYVHRLRAAGHFKAGKVEEALREVALAQAALPGGAEVPILAVPELERLGRKKEAAQVFDRAAAVYEKLCHDYPNCAWAHNSAAWLSACCRRNLDAALAHAEQAVKLAPDNAGHLDTLAEVHFQLGHKDKAVELQKKVIQMEPKKAYFRQQLKRLEAGDPAAERPSEGDE